MNFPVTYDAIINRINEIDPVKYARTRNFIDGDVTCLSPYISRGIITLPQVRDIVLKKGYKPYQIEKFLQELAWREFFQRVWFAKGDTLFTDLKQPQQDVAHHEMISATAEANTGIKAIDDQINQLYETGYMHNHARMYVAGITCNIGKAYWKEPSRWMYYHLLDGDLASNTCSWQWVAGSFSSKKYIANQENINRYLKSSQQHTFLDHSYETIFHQPIPETLREKVSLHLKTDLPATDLSFQIDPDKDICIYTSYWLNPLWRKEEACNRILLLEPDHFEQFPVSKKVIEFITQSAKANIPEIQLFAGSFEALQQQITQGQKIYFMDHPLHRHFKGWADAYPWMFPQVTGSFGSFFSFWKKAERYLKV
jgi:deoxyribodipyrimidine photo-lyase